MATKMNAFCCSQALAFQCKSSYMSHVVFGEDSIFSSCGISGVYQEMAVLVGCGYLVGIAVVGRLAFAVRLQTVHSTSTVSTVLHSFCNIQGCLRAVGGSQGVRTRDMYVG